MEKQRPALREVGYEIAKLRHHRDTLDDAARAGLNSAIELIGITALALGGHTATKAIMDAAEDADPRTVEWLDRQWGHFI